MSRLSADNIAWLSEVVKDSRRVSNKTRVLKAIDRRIKEMQYSQAFIPVFYSQVKKFLKESGAFSPLFLGKVKPAQDITDSVIKQQADNRDTRPPLVVMPEWFDKIKQKKNKGFISALIIYAMGISGRRIGEILGNSDFLKVDNNTVSSRNLSKKKPKQPGEAPDIFKILTNADEFITLVNTIRTKIGNKTSDMDNATRAVNKALKSWVPDAELNSHVFRAIYANLINKFYNPGGLIYNALIAKALNQENTESSISYTFVDLSNIDTNPYL